MSRNEKIELALSDMLVKNILTVNLDKVKFNDIVKYAKGNSFMWKLEDIGRNQKVDLIKSLIKHTTFNVLLRYITI